MNPLKLVIKSLLYFRRRNLLLALGISVSAAVLTGALIVGDSVKYSLNRIVDLRLGQVNGVMQTGERYFTTGLADRYAGEYGDDPGPVLSLDGIAVAGGGQRRLNDIQVLGVDHRFDLMAGTGLYYGDLSGDSVIISRNLAERLNVGTGDAFLLRMTKASLVPVNAPFVSDADNTVSLRVTVSSIAGEDQLGAFHLENSQTAPFNVFISLGRLTQLMELGDRANLLLFRKFDSDPGQVARKIGSVWTTGDLGLNFRYDPAGGFTEIKSDRVFIDQHIAKSIRAVRPDARPVLTYFVNYLEQDGRSTPYSFVSTVPDSVTGGDGIILNRWLADDLKAAKGDTIRLGYYVVGPLRSLGTSEQSFVVSDVIPMTDALADRHLMPDIPGLSDAGNCRDWDTGVPISLDSIRDKDEAYWEQYGGTPKAFISVSVAERLWENRFGSYTSFRISCDSGMIPDIKKAVLADIDPEATGFLFTPVREQASFSAANGVDFSELFGGLSFFLLAGAVLLSVLLFRLNLEERDQQLKTLRSTGIPTRTVIRILLTEGMIIAAVGSLLGIVLAVFYNRLIFIALNSIWMDIVRTRMLEVSIRIPTLLTGFILSVVIAFFSIFIPLRKHLREQRHTRQVTGKLLKSGLSSRVIIIIAMLAALVAVALIIVQFISGEVVNPGIFFAAGGLLLISGLLLIVGFLQKLNERGIHVRGTMSLGYKNALRNRTRSITIVILFAFGTFMVISTGSNKKDLFVQAEERSSGTGGFLYYAESTVPVLQDLSRPEVRFDYGLGDEYELVQMRASEGDDASCLNLNRIRTPRLLGVDPGKLTGRFSFVSSTGSLDETDPWQSLDREIPGNVIPAIADETVIKWSLGMSVGDTLVYQAADGDRIHLLLVGGTAPSIFQGNVLISERNFLTYFPQSSGTNVFLVDGPPADSATIKQELEMAMRDMGWEMEFTASRLAEFNSVTNTYLSIFMVMGALGLLLGTIGLSIVLFRSIIERREELAILRAVGYGKRRIRKLVMAEYLLLFLTGTFTGALAAVIATLPAFLSKHSGASISLVLLILLVLLINGIIWTWWMAAAGVRNKVLGYAMRNE